MAGDAASPEAHHFNLPLGLKGEREAAADGPTDRVTAVGPRDVFTFRLTDSTHREATWKRSLTSFSPRLPKPSSFLTRKSRRVASLLTDSSGCFHCGGGRGRQQKKKIQAILRYYPHHVVSPAAQSSRSAADIIQLLFSSVRCVVVLVVSSSCCCCCSLLPLSFFSFFFHVHDSC